MLPRDPGTVIPEIKVATFCKAAKPWQAEKGPLSEWLSVAFQSKPTVAPAGPEQLWGTQGHLGNGAGNAWASRELDDICTQGAPFFFLLLNTILPPTNITFPFQAGKVVECLINEEDLDRLVACRGNNL